MKPILFNTEMVRALLAYRKTVTRRVIKPQPMNAYRVIDCDEEAHTFDFLCGKTIAGVLADYAEVIKAPCWPGDILYVRETWTKLWYVDSDGYTHYDHPMYFYAADGAPCITLVDGDGFIEDDQRIRWRPSIHMPKEAARLFIQVTGVRVERLQDISDDGAKAEGANYRNGKPVGFEEKCRRSAIDRFTEIWNSTIKSADLPIYSWDANPWVWVIEFERISKPEEMKK